MGSLNEQTPPDNLYVWRVSTGVEWKDTDRADQIVEWVRTRAIKRTDAVWDPQHRGWTTVGEAPEIRSRLPVSTESSAMWAFILGAAKVGCGLVLLLLAVKLVKFLWYL